MLSEISSIFDLFNKLYDAFTKKSINFFIILLTALSIILIKPAIYYSTLYYSFCKQSLIVLSTLIIFFISYLIYHKKCDEIYDSDTLQILMSNSVFLWFLISMGIFKQKNFFENYFADKSVTEMEFIQIIHDKTYFEELYLYVFSNFPIILLLCFELIQMVSFAYCILFIFNRLLLSEEPLKHGLYQQDFNIIFLNSFIVTITSPNLYEIYFNFWNKIF